MRLGRRSAVAREQWRLPCHLLLQGRLKQTPTTPSVNHEYLGPRPRRELKSPRAVEVNEWSFG